MRSQQPGQKNREGKKRLPDGDFPVQGIVPGRGRGRETMDDAHEELAGDHGPAFDLLPGKAERLSPLNRQPGAFTQFSGHPQLVGFGLSRATGRSLTPLTGVQIPLGTPKKIKDLQHNSRMSFFLYPTLYTAMSLAPKPNSASAFNLGP